MQHLEVSSAVRLIYKSSGVKGLQHNSAQENHYKIVKYPHVSHLTINLPLSKYRYAPHNDVSVKDGPLIRRSHDIIIPLCYNCLQYSVHNMLYRFVA